MKQQNFSKGRRGEQIACEFLKKKGYQIIETNFRTRMGEIDIIATKPTLNPSLEKGGQSPLLQGEIPPRAGEGFPKRVLVFVEVKLKSGPDFGTPEDMITKNKLWQVQKTAEAFLWQNHELAQRYKQYRIDAICITLESDGEIRQINHYENVPQEFEI